MTQTSTIQQVQINTHQAEPPKFQVVYLNDDVTTFEFVVLSLQEFFGLSLDQSQNLACEIHERGKGVVAVLPFELAEQRRMEVITLARAQGYPLQVQIQPNE